LPEFHADLSRCKEKRVHCTRYKNIYPFAATLRLFRSGYQNFNT